MTRSRGYGQDVVDAYNRTLPDEPSAPGDPPPSGPPARPASRHHGLLLGLAAGAALGALLSRRRR